MLNPIRTTQITPRIVQARQRNLANGQDAQFAAQLGQGLGRGAQSLFTGGLTSGLSNLLGAPGGTQIDQFARFEQLINDQLSVQAQMQPVQPTDRVG